MTRFIRFCGVALVLGIMASQAQAARLYFTNSGTAGTPLHGVPDVSVAAGETTDIYIWVDLGSDGDLGDGPDQWMSGYGVNVLATVPGVVEAVSSTVFNPNLLIPAFGNAVGGSRWDATTVRHGELNPLGPGTNLLVEDSRAFNVNISGASGIGFDGLSVKPGQAIPFPMVDERYDAVNDVYLAQHIQLRGLPGAGIRSTGLVMQVGRNAFSIDNNPLVENVYFGRGDVPVPNNAVGGTDVSEGPHAMVVVQGPVPTRDIIRFNADAGTTITGTIAGPNGGIPRNLAVGASSGVILIEDWDDSFADIFLDITPSAGNDVESILQTLIAQQGNGSPTDGYTASLAEGSDQLGLGIDYDIRILYPVTAGDDIVFDFDFGATAVVDNVGVPEPSTLVLAALGSVALIGLRRRRK